MSLKAQRFADIKHDMTTLLQGILENDFEGCFWQWHRQLTKCITSQEEYFEGSSSH
jgi:hypothetical protein